MLFPGQQYPGGKAYADGSSIAIDHISGGNYPDGSFSINDGHIYNPLPDGRPGAGYPVNGGNKPINPYDGGNGQQNGGGYTDGKNNIGSNGGQNGQNRPTERGVTNSAPALRNGLFASIWNFVVSWF